MNIDKRLKPIADKYVKGFGVATFARFSVMKKTKTNDNKVNSIQQDIFLKDVPSNGKPDIFFLSCFNTVGRVVFAFWTQCAFC